MGSAGPGEGARLKHWIYICIYIINISKKHNNLARQRTKAPDWRGRESEITPKYQLYTNPEDISNR